MLRESSNCLLGLALVVFVAQAAFPAAEPVNLALVAKSSTSFVSGHETIAALNDGSTPAHSDDKSHGAYGNWPRGAGCNGSSTPGPGPFRPGRSRSIGSMTNAGCGSPKPAA